MNYKHIKCKCGGIIGVYNRNTLTCERCHKEFQFYKLDYDVCLTNEKTGWVFPMKLKEGDE